MKRVRTRSWHPHTRTVNTKHCLNPPKPNKALSRVLPGGPGCEREPTRSVPHELMLSIQAPRLHTLTAYSTLFLLTFYPSEVLAAVRGMDAISLSSLCSAATRCALSRNAWPHRARSACAKGSGDLSLPLTLPLRLRLCLRLRLYPYR